MLLRDTQASNLTASDFAYQLDTSAMHMTFDDEFNSLSLYNPVTGTGTWKTNFISGAQSGSDSWMSRTLATNSEQEIYVDPSYTGVAGGKTALGINPFSITNGVLDIHAAPTPTADLLALDGFKYTSGLLTTQKSFSQTYGYFEIKAEIPTGQGVWPTFWLLPADGSWPPELDALEAVGGNTIYQTAHSGSATNQTALVFTSNVTDVSNTFHTYGVLWNAQDVNFYIDGQEVGSTPTPADMHKPMYMLVNLAVGGNFPGDAPPISRAPTCMSTMFTPTASPTPRPSTASMSPKAPPTTPLGAPTQSSRPFPILSSVLRPTRWNSPEQAPPTAPPTA